MRVLVRRRTLRRVSAAVWANKTCAASGAALGVLVDLRIMFGMPGLSGHGPPNGAGET